jgi:chitinase
LACGTLTYFSRQVDFGIDTYGTLFGKAGISSGSDLTYCYGLDVGYDVFARVEAP